MDTNTQTSNFRSVLALLMVASGIDVSAADDCASTARCDSIQCSATTCPGVTEHRTCRTKILGIFESIDPACVADEQQREKLNQLSHDQCTTLFREQCEVQRDECRSQASFCARIDSEGGAELVRGKAILWVDDNPGHNKSLAAALRAEGASVIQVLSTDEALTQIDKGKPDLIISDFYRRDDASGGYTLLKLLRDRDIHTPYLLYTSSADPGRIAEAKARGAVDETNDPNELISLITQCLKSTQASKSKR